MTRLSALGVKRLSKPGRYGDGGGLWLQVRDLTRKSWLFRYRLHDRDREMGLGSLVETSLAEAREAALACRKLMQAGVDPIEDRKRVRAEQAAAAGAHTFVDVAIRYMDAHKAGWRNAKHAYQWMQSLTAYAYPHLGDTPVARVDTAGVMRALEPIWRTKSETAARLHGRIEAILDYATAHGWRTGENPARWRGHLSNLLPAPRTVAKVEHHAALPYGQVKAFLTALDGEGGTAAVALRFVILTACRTSEAIGATWQEVDRDRAVWTVPGERMKAEREHRVPLSPAALAILATMGQAGTKPLGYVFPGSKGKALSNMAMTALLRRMNAPAPGTPANAPPRWRDGGGRPITVHGIRSTFRDWCSEETSHSREVAEMALAHTLDDKTEAAYRRGDLFAKRAALMADWAVWCGLPPLPGEG